MIRALALVVMVAAAAGCGDAGAVGEVHAWADRACACRDEPCAAKVREEFTRWVETQRSVRGSRTERVAIEDEAKRLFTCVDQRGAGGPTTAPGASPRSTIEPSPPTDAPPAEPEPVPQKPGVED